VNISVRTIILDRRIINPAERVSPGVQNKGFKGIPKSEDTENGFFQWIIIGGLLFALVLLGIIVSLSKKRNAVGKTETKSSHS